MNRHINLPPLTRAADLLPASIDAAERTVEVVWSTGARVRRGPARAGAPIRRGVSGAARGQPATAVDDRGPDPGERLLDLGVAA